MKKALFVATVGRFLGFEKNDIRILQSMGYEVHCAANYSASEIDNFMEKGVIKYQVDFARSPFSFQNVKAYEQLKEIFAGKHFVIVHCHTPVGGVLGRLVAQKYRKTGTKVLYTAHGFHFFKGAPLRNWLLYYPVEMLLSRWTDMLITINKEDYQRAKKKFHARKTVYIPGVGVDTKKFATCSINKAEKRKELAIPQDGIIFLSVGELADRKNHRVVIKALGELQNAKVYYLIAGEGENREEYMELIRQYGLEQNIKLLGIRTDVDELCSIADCFIHPSLREGLGIAPLEAMASGLSLISANVNGIKDYTKNGVTGICVNPILIKDMKRAINKMIEDVEFRKKCGSYNREKAKEFDIHITEKIMRKIYAIYNT